MTGGIRIIDWTIVIAYLVAIICVGFVSSTLCFFIGLGIWAYYQSNGADFPELARNDQIFPVFIASKLPMGIAGLALAGIAAASVSTCCRGQASRTCCSTDSSECSLALSWRCWQVRLQNPNEQVSGDSPIAL